ncbi:MAG: sodium:solute symporter [Microscillaceae bacterium]|jgi:sodium/pantothenate symporter|nr:sodium:solute symporter [Microscillaceae bacterium]
MASPELVTATWILIVIYVVITLLIVVRGAVKTKTVADYALGNVGFSPVAVGLALAASMTSAATFIINPGFVAFYGLSAVLSMAIMLPIGALVSLYVMTKGFRKQGQAVKALTMAQWIGNRYGSKSFALFFAFLSLLLITFIVLICVGLTAILAQSLNLEALSVLIGIVVFVFGYMMFGGANSMVYTNVLQAILMLAVAIILLGSGYEHFSQGIEGFLAKLNTIDPNLTTSSNLKSPLFRDYFEIILCQLIVGIAIVCQPHIITKSLLLKSEKDVNAYLWVGILVEALFFLVIFVGLYARLEFPDLQLTDKKLKVDTIMSAYVVKKFSVYVGLLVVLGLISAGLSTLEGLVQSLSTTITTDIFKPLLGKFIFPTQHRRGIISEVNFNRLIISILGFISILISYQQIQNPNLSVGIFAQNGVYAYFSAAFVPVLFGTFLKDTPLLAVVSAAVTAVVVHFGVYYGQLTPYTQGAIANPGVASALAIISSLLVGGVFYFTFRPSIIHNS